MTSFMNSPLFDFLYLSHTHKEKEREHNFLCSDKLSACPMSRYQQEQVKVKATLSSQNFSLNIFVQWQFLQMSMPVKPSHWGSLWKSRVLTAHSTMKTAQCRWEIARGSNHWIHHKRLEGQPASPDKGGYHNSHYAPPMLQVLSLALRHVCPVGCFFNLRLCSFLYLLPLVLSTDWTKYRQVQFSEISIFVGGLFIEWTSCLLHFLSFSCSISTIDVQYFI